MFAAVSLNIGLLPPQSFEYSIPFELEQRVQPGSVVWVPFRNRKKWGIVESLSKEARFLGKHAAIAEVVNLPEAITQEPYLLALWLSETYLSSLAQAFHAALPLKFFLNPSRNRDADTSRLNIATAQEDFKLTHHQQEALKAILQNFEKARLPTYVLGPTGSGKTYVFLAFIRELLKKKQSAIYLVPEITLTPQFVEIFTRTLAKGTPFAVWSSQTPISLKRGILDSLLSGRLHFVLGTRSAAFLPLQNLKAIIIDEEQDPSFKQENPPPAYHTREAVLWRSHFHGGLTLMASATPSLECYLALKQKKMLKVELPERYGSKALPKITILHQDSPKRTEDLFMETVKERVSRGEHILIFHNRRGYARVLKCESCKNSLNCPRCDLPFTLHKTNGSSPNPSSILRCHHCGAHKNLPKVCPVCQKQNLSFTLTGLGTQRIAETLQQNLGVPVLRLDRETSRQAETIFADFKKGQAPILVGTKLITKGLHFPQISFVGVLNADSEFYLPDFRSGERTFQNLIQVAGRAGRGEKQGEALFVTSNPKHYVFESLAANNWDLFYEKELALRKELSLPPFNRIVIIEIKSKIKQKALDYADLLLESLEKQKVSSFELMGPSQGFFAKIRNIWHYQIAIKLKDMASENGLIRKALFDAISETLKKTTSKSGLKILLRPDPYNLF